MKAKSILLAAAMAVTLPLSAVTVPALAAGEHGGGHGAGPHGAPGNPGDVSRTIEVTMFDNYYEPESLDIEEGETVRFVVTNKGEFVHEFSIATPGMHKDHAPEMMMMMEHGVLEPDRINHEAAKHMQATMGHGMHEEGNSILLEPGKTGEIIWKFPDHAALEFACNVPGHYDAGMTGKIRLSH
ncbi:cupredoxin domain-containing protein [Hwanghaeella sp.]|uniref:cupredoxin domain-containing protein n=1 Tax=Hwanghaeella sp. TaxID=2605943 RepID=UPI003CCB99D4